MLCAGGNIPLITKIEDGNTSDKKANENMLNAVSKHMSENKELIAENFVYIADSALVNKNNLCSLGDNRFITRLPSTYNECHRVIREAVKENTWTDIGVLSQEKPSKNRPLASYRLSEQIVELYDKEYRAIVVHSTANDKRKAISIEKQLDKSKKQLKAKLTPYLKRTYCCKEDAVSEKKEVLAIRTRFHTATVSVEEKVIYKKGRLKKEETRQIERVKFVLKATIEKDTTEVEIKEKEYGCFVLLTNIFNTDEMDENNDEYYSGMKILKLYKEQNYMEKNFSFLKDDRIVNALFIKKPEHIEVIGMILIISLIIWRLLEHEMRKSLKKEDRKVIGWNGVPNKNPTAYMLIMKFKYIMVVNYYSGQTRLGTSLNDNLLDFLSLLGLDESIYINSG